MTKITMTEDALYVKGYYRPTSVTIVKTKTGVYKFTVFVFDLSRSENKRFSFTRKTFNYEGLPLHQSTSVTGYRISMSAMNSIGHYINYYEE